MPPWKKRLLIVSRLLTVRTVARRSRSIRGTGPWISGTGGTEGSGCISAADVLRPMLGVRGQSGQLKLDVDEGTKTSLQGREYRLKITGEESEHKPAGRVADVISALYPDRQETARSLRSLTGMGASAVEHSLEESISSGMIEAKSSLVRGKPSTVYSLTELGRGSHQGLV